MEPTSTNRFIKDAGNVFLQYFADDRNLQYWLGRFKDNENLSESQFLEKSLPTVMLANQYQFRQNVSEAAQYLEAFEKLSGEAFQLLFSALKNSGHERKSGAIQRKSSTGKRITEEISPRKRKFEMVALYQRYLDQIISHHFPEDSEQAEIETAIDKQDFSSAITFVTTHYVAGKGNIALLQDDASEKPDWLSFAKFAHWLATQYLRGQNRVDTRLANSMRLIMARLMFNCAMRKTVYEHKFLVKAFQYFEGAIERIKIQKRSLIRRIDSNIVPNEWSITSILNMAACLLELRLPEKSRDLIKQARNLVRRFRLDEYGSDSEQARYLEAYADYVEGVSHFEDTSPLRSGLNYSNEVLVSDILRQKYEFTKSCLEKSVSVLKEKFRSEPLTASAVTMLSVVLVNISGEFSTEILAMFEDAVNLECALGTGSVTGTFLLQILHAGVQLGSGMESADRCQQLLDRVKQRIKERGAIANGQHLTADVLNPANNDSHGVWPAISRKIEESKPFLDGCKMESLVYFKNSLRKLNDIKEVPMRVLCVLCVSRHYVYTQAISAARNQQSKAAYLLSVGFKIDLDCHQLNRIEFEELRSRFPEDHRFLLFRVTYWLVNEGLILVELASEEHQKTKASSYVQVNLSSSWADQLTKVLTYTFTRVRNALFETFKPRNTYWDRAHDCLNHAKVLIKKLKDGMQDFERSAFIFLEDHLASAFYQLDKMLSVDSMYKTNYKLMFSITELLKDVDELSQGTVQRSQVTPEDPSTMDLILCLHKAQVNFPELARLAELLPHQFNETEEEPKDSFNLDVVFAVSHHVGKLRILQQAYDLCQKAGLVDTELYAFIHMHAGIELFQQAFRDPTRPPYSTLNGAILKFRKAARILELLHPDDVKTAFCYTILGLMYRYHAQLEDQQYQCIRCLERCLSVEKRLVLKQITPSPWLWKGLEIVQFFQQFIQQISKDFYDSTSFIEDLEAWNELNQKFQTALFRNKPLFYLKDFGDSPLNTSVLLADKILIDPLTEWEEKRNKSLKAIAVMMWDREFPKDSPPSDTEVRCYAQYLTKLFDHHFASCPDPANNSDSDLCELDKQTGSDVIKRNDFLRGMNIYPESSAEDRFVIIKQLQKDHNLLLTKCSAASRYDASYQVAY